MPKKQKPDGNKARVPFYVEKINEKTKESFLVDLQNLNHKLEQYEQKHKNLIERNECLENKLKSAKRNERTAIDSINKELAEKSAELLKLKDGLNELKENKMTSKQNAEEKIENLKTDIEEMKNKLTNDNAYMANQLRSLEDFKVHQNEVTSKVTKLKNQLEEKKLENAKEIELMKNASTELALRTKEEAMESLASAASDLKEETMKTMPKLLRRAIYENVAVDAFCEFASNKANSFEVENEKMKGKMIENEKLLRTMERKEKELFKEVVEKKKLIKLLKEKLSGKIIPTSSEGSFKQFEDENDFLKNGIEKIKQEHHDLERDSCEIRSEVDGLKKRMKEVNNKLETLRSVLYQANIFIKRLYFEDHHESKMEHIMKIYHLLKDVDNT